MKEEIKLKSADDIIVKEEAQKLGKPIPEESPQNIEASHDTGEENVEAVKEEETSEDKAVEEENKIASEELPQDEDEYGTKIETKKKLYTEDEVNQMIRDRLKRGNHPENQTQVQEAAKDFKADPESSEDWEVQLENFIERKLQKISKEQAEKQWKKQQEQTQAEFEVKFTQGMTKYNDFEKVVADKPITGSMMLATRSMTDPAAFIYAACKQHPQELTRIANIADPVAQATEIGRLEERMKKARSIPVSPKPSSKVSEDVVSDMPKLNIDQKIAAHAKTKFAR